MDDIIVVQLGLNGKGPWIMFPLDEKETLSGLVEMVKEGAGELCETEDTYTIRCRRMSPKAVAELPEFEGW